MGRITQPSVSGRNLADPCYSTTPRHEPCRWGLLSAAAVRPFQREVAGIYPSVIADATRPRHLQPRPPQSSIVFLVGQESLGPLSGRKLFRIFWPTGGVRGQQTS